MWDESNIFFKPTHISPSPHRWQAWGGGSLYKYNLFSTEFVHKREKPIMVSRVLLLFYADNNYSISTSLLVKFLDFEVFNFIVSLIVEQLDIPFVVIDINYSPIFFVFMYVFIAILAVASSVSKGIRSGKRIYLPFYFFTFFVIKSYYKTCCI